MSKIETEKLLFQLKEILTQFKTTAGKVNAFSEGVMLILSLALGIGSTAEVICIVIASCIRPEIRDDLMALLSRDLAKTGLIVTACLGAACVGVVCFLAPYVKKKFKFGIDDDDE